MKGEDNNMAILEFTVEEINLIAIYKANTIEATIDKIIAAFPYMQTEIQEIAATAARRLRKMTEEEFAITEFIPAV